MPSHETLGLFVIAAVLFAAIPGPAVFYIVTRSVSQGRQAGVVSAVGVGTGNLLYVAASILGLTALLASSAAALALLAGSAGSWLRRRPGVERGTRLVPGGAYIALGVGAALAGERRPVTSG